MRIRFRLSILLCRCDDRGGFESGRWSLESGWWDHIWTSFSGSVEKGHIGPQAVTGRSPAAITRKTLVTGRSPWSPDGHRQLSLTKPWSPDGLRGPPDGPRQGISVPGDQDFESGRTEKGHIKFDHSTRNLQLVHIWFADCNLSNLVSV